MEQGRFPNRLQRYRRYFQLSQKDVTTLLGLPDTSTLSRWEKGRSLPSIAYLFRLSRMYKTLPQELYSDLWQKATEETARAEKNLLAHKESVINNQTFYI